MNELPTVRVVREDSPKGCKIINESDFDPQRHTPYGDSPQLKKRKTRKQNGNA